MKASWKPSSEFGSVYAGHVFTVQPAVADHFNNIAAAQRDAGTLPDGEYTPFAAGEYVMIAMPTEPLPADEYLDLYQRMRVQVGDTEIRLDDHPHLFSSRPDDRYVLRGVPTLVPVSTFPSDYFGQVLEVTVLVDEEVVDGPVRRVFHDETTAIHCQRLVPRSGGFTLEGVVNRDSIEARRDDVEWRCNVAMFCDPAFGEVVGSVLHLDGEVEVELDWKTVGADWLGDQKLFHERAIAGVDQLLDAESFRLDVDFERPGPGLLSIYAVPGRISADAWLASAVSH